MFFKEMSDINNLMQAKNQKFPCEVDENHNSNALPKSIDNLENWIKQNDYINTFPDDVSKNLIEGFLLNLWNGTQHSIDFANLNKLNDKPDWLDLNKLKTGQKFAEEFYSAICLSEIVCLLLVLSNDTVLRKLIWTGKSSDAYLSFKRYLSTGKKVRSMLISDLLDNDSEGSKNIRNVNYMHQSFQNKLEKVDEHEFMQATELKGIESTVCPFLIKDCQSINSPTHDDELKRVGRKIILQSEMTGTQFSFVSLLILNPENFGICPVEHADGLEGFIHLWRYIAYRLGTADMYNLCTGSIEEVKAKSQIILDLVIKPNLKLLSPRWEHMTRSIIEGVQFYTDCFTYETHLLFGLDLINVEHDQLYRNCSFKSRMELQIMKFLNKYLMSLSWFRCFFNNFLLKKIDKVSEKLPTVEEFKKKIRYTKYIE